MNSASSRSCFGRFLGHFAGPPGRGTLGIHLHPENVAYSDARADGNVAIGDVAASLTTIQGALRR